MGSTGPHFSESELMCPHCGINGATQRLVDALEAFREKVGKPVIVDSAYRCPTHNAAVGGAPHSEHMQGLAADIRVEGIIAGQLEAVARTIPQIRGIGRADHQQYVHIDVRNTLTLAQWCYGMDGKTVPYYGSPEIELPRGVQVT